MGEEHLVCSGKASLRKATFKLRPEECESKVCEEWVGMF